MAVKKFIPYAPVGSDWSDKERLKRVSDHFEFMSRRRSLREFSSEPVDRSIIEYIIRTAGTAPSGAHKQPWSFCAVSDPAIKSEIRKQAEEEEYENYHGRMSDEWLHDLEVFDTDWHKPFLEEAPWLIVIFKKAYDIDKEGKKKNYYVNESVGIAVGMLISAIHHAGLVALTHTPSPMNFLSDILSRPENERPFLLMPVGYPAQNAQVPDLKRKSVEEIAQFYG